MRRNKVAKEKKEPKEEKIQKVKFSDGEKDLLSLFGEDALYLDGNIDTIGSYDIIRTGSPSLDYALGIGGFPRGRIIQVAGKESSGKTLLSLLAMKSWLDENPDNTVMFIDAEYTYDPKWAKQLGVDVSRVIVAKTNDAKKIFEGLVGRMTVNKTTKKSSKTTKGVLDLVKEGIDPRFKNLGLIVLDSVAAMQTPMEIDALVGKQNMAPMPRFLATELKKLTPALADANVAMIFINQVRVNPGATWGNPETTPGGKALKHACSIMINMAPMYGSDNMVEDDNEEQIGHKVKAKIEKNKVGPPYREAEYSIQYTSGFIKRNEELLDLGVLCGVVVKPTTMSYEFCGEKYVGRENALSAISSNQNIFMVIEDECRAKYIAGLVVGSYEKEDVRDEPTDFLDSIETGEEE